MIDAVVRIDTTDRASHAHLKWASDVRAVRTMRSRCHPTLTSVSPEMGRAPFGVRPTGAAASAVSILAQPAPNDPALVQVQTAAHSPASVQAAQVAPHSPTGAHGLAAVPVPAGKSAPAEMAGAVR